MKRIYELLFKISKLNPWSMLTEQDIIQIFKPDGNVNMVSFVEEEIKAINAFVGIEACGNYVTSLRVDEENSGYSVLRYLDAYSVYFVDESKVDKASFEKYGFNNETGYPIVSRNMYGYFQRTLNNEEIETFVIILEHVYKIITDSIKNNIKVSYALDAHLTRTFNKTTKKYVNIIADLVDIRSGIKPVPANIDFDMKSTTRKVELDVVILPKIDKKVLLLALAVGAKGEILYQHVTDEYESRSEVLANALLEVLKIVGKVKLIIRDRIDQAYLANIIREAKLDYEIKALTHLDKHADKTVEEMLEL